MIVWDSDISSYINDESIYNEVLTALPMLSAV
jgi:hypothetical protein